MSVMSPSRDGSLSWTGSRSIPLTTVRVRLSLLVDTVIDTWVCPNVCILFHCHCALANVCGEWLQWLPDLSCILIAHFGACALGTVSRRQLFLNVLHYVFQSCHFPPQLLRVMRSFCSSEITQYRKQNLSSPYSLLVPNNRHVLRHKVPTQIPASCSSYSLLLQLDH